MTDYKKQQECYLLCVSRSVLRLDYGCYIHPQCDKMAHYIHISSYDIFL